MSGEIFLIYARAANGTIGQGGAMPWHIPADLKRFKALTLGKPMVMGRKTFDSLPGLLPGRRHIVLTRSRSWSAEGAEVAHSVDEALQVLDQKPFDVVVTDLAMPGADGFALVRRLREGGPLHARALPVIAVSAYARGADRDRVLAEGFQGYLGKPLEFEQLMAMIAHVSGKAVN